jgi:hypothetical protein
MSHSATVSQVARTVIMPRHYHQQIIQNTFPNLRILDYVRDDVRGQFFYIFLCFYLWRGDLTCRHGEATFYLVSLAQYTGVTRVTYKGGGANISSVSFGTIYPLRVLL